MGSSLTREAIRQAAARLEHAPPEAVLAWARDAFGARVCLASSFGAEDMALIDAAGRVFPGLDVFYLDTGLFFPETYRLIEQVAARYPVRLIPVRPQLTVEEQAERFGEALWAKDPDRCCQIRKVDPLRRFLQDYDAWITGIRRQQSPERAGCQVVEWDGRFGLVKVNPLACWTHDDVWAYIRRHGVPYNPLHDRGYPSIGCWPCTTPVRPGEDLRAGRWRGFAKVECGLHTKQTARPEGRPGGA